MGKGRALLRFGQSSTPLQGGTMIYLAGRAVGFFRPPRDLFLMVDPNSCSFVTEKTKEKNSIKWLRMSVRLEFFPSSRVSRQAIQCERLRSSRRDPGAGKPHAAESENKYIHIIQISICRFRRERENGRHTDDIPKLKGLGC